MSHIKAIYISGITWLVMGSYLLYKGLYYSITCVLDMPPLITWLSGILGSVQNGIIMVIAAGLTIGFFKGRYILIKTVRRVVRGIVLQPTPIKLRHIYTNGYLILILSMMALGMTLRFLPIGGDVRGLVDTAIGCALINGSLIYFRLGLMLKRERQ
ncbi:MAG: hypothetical protein KDK44_00995 [Chlamydiia bacterium]|nr:hypothetical protein [Chlamydiia bacterium]MCP5508870.1 hypothetical protein [Chlamydiales bacterium]HPE84722.1 hypothetical protein [Chlamydiales bacterium]